MKQKLFITMAAFLPTLIVQPANATIMPFAGRNYTTNGVLATGMVDNGALSGTEIRRSADDIPADSPVTVSGAGDLRTLIVGEVGDGNFGTIKTLIIQNHVITQEEFDFLATDLQDLVTLNLADATLPDDVRLDDEVKEKSVHWQFLILPKGTKIRPNFTKYSNLKYAVDGGLEKIWIVSPEAGYITKNIDYIASILPEGINNPADGIRLSVAFVGSINVDDVAALVSHNTPLSSARIWHLYNSTGLSMDDFGRLGGYIQGNNNGEKPTGFVLPPGMNVDDAFAKLSSGGHSGDIGNVYSLSSGENDNGITLTVRIVNTATFDIARFATVDTKKAILQSLSYGWPSKPVDANIIKALNGTKRCISVDLSGMQMDDDAILNGVTEGTVMYVKLPGNVKFNIDNYQGTTFGAIARVKTEWGASGEKKVAVCYQRVPGTLNKIVGYRSQEMLEYPRIRYRGLINMHDVEHLLDNNKNIYCDMSDVRVVKYLNPEDEGKSPKDFKADMVVDREDRDMSLIHNNFIQYLALPEGTTIPENVDAFKSQCPKLLGVGAFDNTTKALAYHSYALEGGAAGDVISMFVDDGDKIGNGESSIKALTMSGTLNFHDITPGNNCGAGGHYSSTGSGCQGTHALNANNTTLLEECDFSDAVFPTQKDMYFQVATIYHERCKKFKLPISEKMTIIPDSCMENFTKVTELCIPANYRTIGKSAFKNMTGLKKITTTAVQSEDNITDRGEGTIVLSYNLEEIATEAFVGINTMYDVYVLAEKAPKCASGAFDAGMLYGNNGFTNVHPSKRMNYINEGKIIGMLHYPRVIVGTEEEKNYTDITRKYTLIDETGALNGKGELFVWPTHSEFGRSYRQAKCTVEVNGEQRGCNWGAWKEYDANGDLIWSEGDGVILEGELTMDNTYNLDYAGWHEFVLANNYYRKASEGEITPDYSKFKEQDWYTICFPYNLTRSQLLKYFGVSQGETYNDGDREVAAEKDIYPDVRTLVEVKRHRNYSKEGGLITFVFSNNLITEDGGMDVEISSDKIQTAENGDRYMTKDTKPWNYVDAKTATDEELFDNDPIIVKGGYPYIIRPYIPVGKVNDDVHFIPAQSSDELGGGHSIVVNEATGAKVSVPYIKHQVYAIDVDNSTEDKEMYAKDGEDLYHYHFIGTYGFHDMSDSGVESVALQYKEMPMYSFFISKTKSNPRHLLYRTMTDGVKWNALTSIIGGNSSAQYMNLSRNEGDMTNVYVDFQCDNDAFEDINGNSKKTILAMDFAEEHGGTTGITDYTSVPQENAKRGVYSLDGRFVGTRTDNLPKGIYVANGKKYIVK